MINSASISRRRVLRFCCRTFLFFTIGQFLDISGRCESAEINLAEDLFSENNFHACIQECSRILVTDKNNETASLLKILSEFRTGNNCTASLREFAESAKYSKQAINAARYELAMAYWKTGNCRDALDYFRKIFLSADKGNLFIKSSCCLCMIIEDNPEYSDSIKDIRNQLETTSALWTREMLDDCRLNPAKPGNSASHISAKLAITFYRNQIGSAIGRRCSLVPSCSEYSLQSFKKHGLFGLAMTGDRIIREPDVVAEKPHPLRIGKRWYYTDAVEEHDWWMTSQNKSLTFAQ